jgi:hypothetical protein
MQATLGEDVVATLVAPSVLPAFPMGARIEVPYTRAIVSYWRPAAYDPVSGLWTVVLEAPVAAGDYQLVWRDSGPEPPEMEVMIPLVAARAGVEGVIVGGPWPWQPSVEEVAAETPAYTRGGFDDDRESAGAEQGEFTEDTSPRRSEVEERKIPTACEEIAGRVGTGIPESQYGLAKITAIWHVKASIAADKQPAGTDDATGEYRSAIARYLANLEALILNSRPRGGRLA